MADITPLIHIVLFQFKADITPEKRQELSDKMLGLRTNCVHPTTQQPYIKSSVGGTDNSIEGLQHGITHAFVVEFNSIEDRDYYVNQDPAHAAFVKEVIPQLEKPQIIDFCPGVFSLTK